MAKNASDVTDDAISAAFEAVTRYEDACLEERDPDALDAISEAAHRDISDALGDGWGTWPISDSDAWDLCYRDPEPYFRDRAGWEISGMRLFIHGDWFSAEMVTGKDGHADEIAKALLILARRVRDKAKEL